MMTPKAYAQAGLALGASLLVAVVAQTVIGVHQNNEARAASDAYRKVVCAQGQDQNNASIAVTNAFQDYCR